MKEIAILALQGAFEEHARMLSLLGAGSVLIRNLQDWEAYLADHPLRCSESCTVAGSQSVDTVAGNVDSIARKATAALIIPGGESTSMMKIMRDEALLEPIRQAILAGMPTFGTCAGMILLGRDHLGCMDITVKRNAYGRQLGSFHAVHDFRGIGNVLMTFIRAPYVEQCGDGVEVLSELDGHIIAVRQGNMLATAFHPELTDDLSVHKYFCTFI